MIVLVGARHEPIATTVETGNASDVFGVRGNRRGKRVRFEGPRRSVVDGPFAATGELVAGFWLWQVKDMAEAVEWVKRCPNPMLGPSEIEIRPIFEAPDFGDTLTPEIADREERMREKLASRTPRS